MGKPTLLSVDDDVLRAIERDLRSKYSADYRVIGSGVLPSNGALEACLGGKDSRPTSQERIAASLKSLRGSLPAFEQSSQLPIQETH